MNDEKQTNDKEEKNFANFVLVLGKNLHTETLKLQPLHRS